MADITYYVALPFLHDDTGSLAAGAAEECQSASGAIRRAEVLSRAPGSIGALAFSRTGDPMMGEFSDAQVIRASAECRPIPARRKRSHRQNLSAGQQKARHKAGLDSDVAANCSGQFRALSRPE